MESNLPLHVGASAPSSGLPFSRAMLIGARPSTWDFDTAFEHMITLCTSPWDLLKVILWCVCRGM